MPLGAVKQRCFKFPFKLAHRNAYGWLVRKTRSAAARTLPSSTTATNISSCISSMAQDLVRRRPNLRLLDRRQPRTPFAITVPSRIGTPLPRSHNLCRSILTAGRSCTTRKRRIFAMRRGLKQDRSKIPASGAPLVWNRAPPTGHPEPCAPSAEFALRPHYSPMEPKSCHSSQANRATRPGAVDPPVHEP